MSEFFQKCFKYSVVFGLVLGASAQACTGIALSSEDKAQIVARTIEWGDSKLNSQLVISPRGRMVQTHTAHGQGMKYSNSLGFVGVSIEEETFVVEGINEKGLSAGLFFFPGYGEYPAYQAKSRAQTLSDMQFVGWMLGNFDSIDAVKRGIKSVRLAALIPEAGTVHYRVADKSGRQIVIESIDGKIKIFDNPVGVLTNSPDFPWHLKNLNNYLNLKTGKAESVDWSGVKLSQFGMGAGMLGIPGDITPPSRFVRAAYMQSTAPKLAKAKDAVLYSFTILNSFEIPIGLELKNSDEKTNLISATQWTSATDMTNGVFYYKTDANYQIRSVELKNINFAKVKYQVMPLDRVNEQPIEALTIK